jgi:signal transduction histidine kinase
VFLSSAIALPSCPEVEVFGNVNASEPVSHVEQDRRIETRTHNAADPLFIDVEDNGRGIPAAIRPRLFDALASIGNQQGLDWVFCRDILRVHGGSIKADLARERGCLFAITLPSA